MRRKSIGKKALSTILVVAMALSVTACGGNSAGSEGEAASVQKENAEVASAAEGASQTEFNIMAGMSALSPGYEDNEVLNSMQEKVGVSIEWNTYYAENTGKEALPEQVTVRIAGGDLPDAFMGVGFKNYDVQRYADDGTFIDLTPYLTEECMPNLAKILAENPDIKSAITMADGGIYGLPAAEKMGTAGIGKTDDYSIFTVPQYSMINKAWLDDLGLEVPTTLDELHVVLQAFEENDMSAKYYGNDPGTTIPMSTGFDQWCWGQNIFYAGFGFTNWINDVCKDLILSPEGTAEFVCVSDEYREALTYFHNWFEEGLIDKEMFSQTDQQYLAKCQQGYVGVGTWWYIEELMGEYAADYVFLPVLEGPNGDYNVTVRTGGATNCGQLSVTSACEDPATLLKFFDEWYNPENVMQLQYGPIGVFFTEQDENGVWKSITEDEAKEKYGKGAGELKAEHEVYGPKLILSEYYSSTFAMEDRAIERLTDLNDYWMKYVDSTETYPVDCVYTTEELEIIDQYRADFENTVAEYEGRWLLEGGLSDAEWDEYISVLTDNCNMDELLKVYQAAYDRYASAK